MTGTQHVERELKLGAWPEFVLPDLDGFVAGVTAGQPTRRELDAIYYDTADLSLLRRGATLRFRTGEPPGDVWTTKLPSDGAAEGLARREITLPGRRAAVPALAVDLTRAWTLGRALRPVARVHTMRTSIALRDGGGRVMATLDDDAVTVLRGRRALARFRELEVELGDNAPPALLDAVDERLRAAGAEKVAQIPKLGRALGQPAAQPWALAAAPLGSKTTVADAARHAVVEGLAQLVDLHALLVLDVPGSAGRTRRAAARVSVALDAYTQWLALERAPAARQALARLEAALAPVAELEVALDMLGSAAGRAELGRGRDGLAARLESARQRGHARLLRALREPRYCEATARLARSAPSAPAASPAGKRRLASSAGKLARAEWRVVRHDVDTPAAVVSARAAVERLAATLAALPVSGVRAALARVGELGVALDSRADALAAATRLRASSRRLGPDEAWTAGVVAGLAAAQAEADAQRAASAWELVARKATWSWAD